MKNREDVLYKILLRAVKRFYWEKWWNGNNLIYSLTRIEEIPIFQKIDKLVDERFQTSFTEQEINGTPSLTILHDSNFNLSKSSSLLLEVKIMIASIIIRKNMKKYINRCNLRRIWEKYYEVIYKYSYQRLATLLKSRSLQLIFKNFYESSDFQEMLVSDESLAKDKEAYDYRAKRMVQYIVEI